MIEIKSPVIDYYIEAGVGADGISRASVEVPDVEVRIRNGLAEIWRGERCVARVGTAFCELTSDDWKRIAAKMVVAP